MINLNEMKLYQDLIKLKKKNEKIKSKYDKYIIIGILILIALLSYVGVGAIIFFILIIVVFKTKNYAEVMPVYHKFYYETFFPDLLERVGISDMTKIEFSDSEKLLRRSGLYNLEDGSMHSCTCFLRKNNEFNYFGCYKKTVSSDDGVETTFDGTFFIKELQSPLYSDIIIKKFRLSDESVFNKKGYSGMVTINNKEIRLNDNCIKLLGELEKRYGKVYLLTKNNCLAIQFADFETCSNYRLNPYLENGQDTDNHFQFIELSMLEEEFSSLIQELLSELQYSK